MDFEKLYRPSALNSFQFIAVTGLIMSGAAHIIIKYLVAHPLPAGFPWLYVCWTALYIVGSFINLFGKPSEGHHHHH